MGMLVSAIVLCITCEAEHEICRLFATIELLLKNHSCKRSVEECERSLPRKLDYHSGVCEYLFYNHIVEVSLVIENVNDTKGYYYYVVLSVSSILTFLSQKNQ